MQSARVGSPRAQQHGGVRFCMAPRQQPEHSSTAACASAERPWRHVNSQSTTARRRALLQERPWQPGHSSTAACASVGRHVSQSKTARRGLLSQGAPRGPRATLAPPVALGGCFFLPCFAPAAPGAARRNARLGCWAPFGPVWPRRAPRGSRPHTSAGATARWRALLPSAFFFSLAKKALSKKNCCFCFFFFCFLSTFEFPPFVLLEKGLGRRRPCGY